ncbi:hypothetical protein [Hymenobacter siberiensis]|uniref:hypothetical protein n=1 Tax=Hymenobacter siberiensis TaxID=2848396 RepID=UPI001C1E3890|nr:hypothetical protein [Hymenobacter siberiensis]MBU6122563.1 hypothetical protein [Hymenobacter siberiensis]
MLQRLLLLLAFALSYTFQTQAQAFEPGMLVRANGDTLRGEIENSFWVEPPTAVRFRHSAESPTEIFKPRQLRSFSLTGGRYFRYEALPIDHAAESRFEYIHRGNATNIHVDSLLAEVLVEGSVSLLRVGRLSGPHFLVLGRSNQPVLDLSAQQYLRQSPTGAWKRTDGNNYRGLLGMYFDACPAAFAVIQTAPFTPEGLAEVVQIYNQSCSPAQQPGRNWLVPAQLRHPVALQGGLLAGLRYNRTERITAPISTATGACVDCQPHLYAGLYAELLQPSRTGALYGEISLSRFTGAGTESVYQYGTVVLTDYRYQAWLATARLGVRHFFRLPREQQLILGLGYELNQVLSPTLTVISGPSVAEGYDVNYARPTFFPNVDLSWRANRLTATIDGQMYADSREARSNQNAVGGTSISSFFSGMFFGSNFALRLGLAYRLGHNPDKEMAKTAPAQP